MGAVQFGIPKELIKKIKEVYPIDNFVETGTYLGETSYWASTQFKHTHTIEISDELHQEATKRYSKIENLHFHLGDSKDVIPKIVKQLDGPALFWLDGHWCGRNTGGKGNLCPVMDELQAASSVKGSVILIDDLRCFLGPMAFDSEENYPSVHEIILYLHERLPDNYVTFHDDTIICAPSAIKEIIDADWKLHFPKRYPNTFKNKISKMAWRIKRMNFNNEYE